MQVGQWWDCLTSEISCQQNQVINFRYGQRLLNIYALATAIASALWSEMHMLQAWITSITWTHIAVTVLNA